LNYGTTDAFLVIVNNDDTFYFQRKYANSWNAPSFQVHTITTLSPNTWYFVVATRDENRYLKLYINGQAREGRLRQICGA